MSDDPLLALYPALQEVALNLGELLLADLQDWLRASDRTAEGMAEWSARLRQPPQRESVRALSDAWMSRPLVSGKELAAALTILRETRCRRPEPQVVWSGPITQHHTYRGTGQVMQELIRSARRRLLIVTYALGEVEYLRQDVEAALDREVAVRLVLEHFDSFQQKCRMADLQRLGQQVLHGSEILLWPEARRPQVDGQPRGSLHTKCLVQDSAHVLFTSANWTSAAMNLNMEMGVLMPDPGIARAVWQHFDELILDGVLQKWTPA